MITDVFFRRYEDVPIFSPNSNNERLFNQAAQIITKDILARNETRYKEAKDDPASQALVKVHELMERELGLSEITPRYWYQNITLASGVTRHARPWSIENRTTNYLIQAPTNDLVVDLFCKRKVSVIELAFQQAARQLAAQRLSLAFYINRANPTAALELLEALKPDGNLGREKEKLLADEGRFKSAVSELNVRFQQAKMPQSYNNGLIQISRDELAEREVEQPFWRITSAPKWEVVDRQMKEALDERDRGGRNPISPAINALETVIKTISSDKGWNTGNEKGASNYIDNLVKVRGGVRFIAVWEKEALTSMFRDIRNMFGHGPQADEPLPTLRPEQADWAVKSCMLWVSSLLARFN